MFPGIYKDLTLISLWTPPEPKNPRGISLSILDQKLNVLQLQHGLFIRMEFFGLNDEYMLIFRIYTTWCGWMSKCEYLGKERTFMQGCVCECIGVCVGPPVGPSIPLLHTNSGQMWPLPFTTVHLILSFSLPIFLPFFGKPSSTFTLSPPSPHVHLTCQVQSFSYSSWQSYSEEALTCTHLHAHTPHKNMHITVQ